MENQQSNETSREIRESQSSVEVSVNAKGQWSGKVKAYADSSDEAMVDALAKAQKLDTLIRSKNKIEN
jgi:biopolymer transport protein ExbD|tara:strand:+ start:2248 stop:2451 length:204 start_codon:yes stop_codon:yes gene_type:complete